MTQHWRQLRCCMGEVCLLPWIALRTGAIVVIAYSRHAGRIGLAVEIVAPAPVSAGIAVMHGRCGSRCSSRRSRRYSRRCISWRGRGRSRRVSRWHDSGCSRRVSCWHYSRVWRWRGSGCICRVCRWRGSGCIRRVCRWHCCWRGSGCSRRVGCRIHRRCWSRLIRRIGGRSLCPTGDHNEAYPQKRSQVDHCGPRFICCTA